MLNTWDDARYNSHTEMNISAENASPEGEVSIYLKHTFLGLFQTIDNKEKPQ